MGSFGEFINTLIDIRNFIEEDIKKTYPKACIDWNDYTWWDFEDRKLIVYYSTGPCKCAGSCNDDKVEYSFEKIIELLGEE